MAQLNDPQPYVCTPSSLLASNPCLACLSHKELLAAFLGIMAISDAHYRDDLQKLLQDSACFTCLSDSQMEQALVTIFGNGLLGDLRTVPEVIDYIKCLECASDKQIKAAILFMWCHFLSFTIEPPET